MAVSATPAAAPGSSVADSSSDAAHTGLTGSSAAPIDSSGSSAVSSLVAAPAVPLDRPHT
jgi:hypothetical protein